MKRYNFREWITATLRERGPIILALDYVFKDPEKLFHRSIEILKAVSPYICGVKINRHLVIPLGLYSKIKEIVNFTHKLGLPALMDCKINDIGSTNVEIAKHYYNQGFDAITANPFVGWEEGLKPVFRLAKKLGKGVILLVYMSHKGSIEGYGQRVIDQETGTEQLQYLVFAKKALEWNADGVVVGATYPKKILEVTNVLQKRIPIYSPGVGVQGGDAQLALDAGATFIIIGRSILFATNPIDVVRKLSEVISENSL